jgi:hypothetical protein
LLLLLLPLLLLLLLPLLLLLLLLLVLEGSKLVARSEVHQQKNTAARCVCGGGGHACVTGKCGIVYGTELDGSYNPTDSQ